MTYNLTFNHYLKSYGLGKDAQTVKLINEIRPIAGDYVISNKEWIPLKK